jgi:hypothetical protein
MRRGRIRSSVPYKILWEGCSDLLETVILRVYRQTLNSLQPIFADVFESDVALVEKL